MANVKRCRNAVKVFMDALEAHKVFIDENMNNVRASEVKLRLHELNEQYKQFKVNQTVIEDNDDDALEDTVRIDVDKLYFLIRPALEDKLEELKAEKKHNVDSSIKCEELSFIPKLPDLTLETFNGDLKRWRPFIETFNTHIHNNPRLNSLTKFQYLKNVVIGSAAKPIENLDFNGDNYEVARQLLVERFDKPKLIIEDHIHSIFHAKKLDKPNSQKLLELLDEFNAHIRSLTSMDRPTQHWDDMLVYLIASKFDPETKSKWRDDCNANRLPTFDDVSNFIKKRSAKLNSEKAEVNYQQSKQSSSSKSSKTLHQSDRKGQSSFTTTKGKGFFCVLCNENGHSIMRCHKFLNLSVRIRNQEVDKLKICKNCLRQSHLVDQCQVNEVCRTCKEKHHTLLHLNDRDSSNSNSSVTTHQPTSISGVSSTALHQSPSVLSSATISTKFVFLATALIEVVDRHNSVHKIRALLDSGSQINFITESLASKLGVDTTKSLLNIHGIACSSFQSSRSAVIEIRSRINNFSTKIECQILSNIASEQPRIQFDVSSWKIPPNVPLADPRFYVPQKIDMLIGAEIFFDLQSIGQIKLGDDLPLLQNTRLGWVISGKINNPNVLVGQCNVAATESLDLLLERFWNVDSHEKVQSNQHLDCEQYFIDNTTRDDAGRFVVRIPFHQPTNSLGESAFIARRRFLNLERKLTRDPNLSQQYHSFMAEYINLDHMEQVNVIERHHYYLPHHCVLTPDSSSTKLRVVFDGSAKTTSGIALNEIMMVGPVVQNEMFANLLRFRAPAFAISADIAKMYRQIRVHEDDQRFQYIFWRFSEDDPIETYRLKTVTYGTTSASYLSTRCLLQLAIDYQKTAPDASNAIRNDFYVDNLLTGTNSIETLREIKSEVSFILESAGMYLRKWCGNNPLLIEDVDESDRETILQIDEDEFVKTLGLYWQSDDDFLRIKVNFSNVQRVTKRHIMSDIAKIFDPIGIISPVVVIGKLLMQRLWQLKCEWDESLPMSEYTYWNNFRNDLQTLRKLCVPRHLFYHCTSPSRIQIHGFADASEKAFGAVLYVRFHTPDGIKVSLLCSRSKIAPLKNLQSNLVTLPRLELCAAQLLAQFVDKVQRALNFDVEQYVFWTDSMIVLCWLNSTASKWKPFVANRVKLIQSVSDPSMWHHVGSKNNPADIISRGMLPSKLLNNKLWWHGPEFLHDQTELWAHRQELTQMENVPEQKVLHQVSLASENEIERNFLLQYLEKYSNYLHIQNVLARVLRFIKNAQSSKLNLSKLSGRISADESRNAENCLLRLVQRESFPEIYRGLQSGNFIVRDKKLSHLSLFMDEDNLIRVGGRLRFSALSYSSRHPILLPHKYYIVLTLVNFIHRCHIHVGPQGLLAAVRRRFWIVSGKSVVQRVYNQCVGCAKFKPQLMSQKMGDLPASRVSKAMPFVCVGVDYCGPFYIHYKIRGKIPTKCYVAVFVCFTTKAVHMDVASDLSTDAFMGVLKRFIATRGLPKKIVSDNGTNFVGSNNELHELFNLLISKHFNDEISIMAQRDKIEWSMAPPGSPHFGGLYEAAVKSAKNHLLRITSKANLTFEELLTLVKQVEAILNSRPLMTISADDPVEVLTPGHFLVGRPLTAIPEPSDPEDNLHLLTRWKFVKDLHKFFWNRWSNEYLHELQYRHKWKDVKPNIRVGTIVLIKDNNAPPLRWKLGKIEDVHKGADGLIRVVSIKTSTGIMKRSIVNIAPLPIDLELPVQGGEHVHA